MEAQKYNVRLIGHFRFIKDESIILRTIYLIANVWIYMQRFRLRESYVVDGL